MFKLSFLLVLFVALISKNVFCQGDAVGTEAVGSVPDEGTPSTLLEGVIHFSFEEVDRALENGENINVVNVNDWSAARFAVASGDIEMLAHLIAKEIDLNLADNLGQTPLMIAAAQCDKELVELLLDHNANPLAEDNNGTVAYDYAVNAGRKFLALLIAEQSTLYAIASSDMKSVLKTVIEQGAYVNIRNDVGFTPLLFAAHENDLDAVKKLIAHGADLNRAENDGWTAIHFAADYGNAEMVKALFDGHADYTLRNAAGKTARDIGTAFPEIQDILPPNVEEEL